MARLPIPYKDEDWGPILNDYLLQAHSPNGTLKAGTVGSGQIQDGAITPQKLSKSVRMSLPRITVGSTPPADPQDGDIWFDTSEAEA